ncbi:hypothetical protein JRQ81_009192 [Phrynocephalus forsythii]|uniref:LRAT domain-containing protein n=1 Tax=Phrynocephalus forsythii TaxID=171643 RepID=A0A9Q0X9X8_9SAUR|nr:hypothetical protein JRQ81_009192 [Phrynocephalus forsythii]
MSDIFFKLCERGLCYQATQLPMCLPTPGGPLKEAGDSASLRPWPWRNQAPSPPPGGPAKAEPERAAQRPKGASGLGRKEGPTKKEPPGARRGWSLVWKKTCCRPEVTSGRPQPPEDAPLGKGVRSQGSAPKGFGARAPQPAGAQDKQRAKNLDPLMGGKPARPLPPPPLKANGAHLGVAPKAPPGAPKTKAPVGLKRTKKPPRQTSSFKGTPLAAAHGNMEIKMKHGNKNDETRPPDPADLVPGDLIEIFRFGYQHWAIYVGNGYVVHLAPPTEYPGAGCASLMSTLTDKALVKKERLRDVVGTNRYRVNNKHDSKYPPLPPAKIVQRAEERVGQELAYKVTSENCEHFVTELRYGVARSDQVRDAVGYGLAGLGLAALGLFGFAMAKKKKNQQTQ